MNIDIRPFPVLAFAVVILIASHANAVTKSITFEKVSRTVDDGNQIVMSLDEKTFDSSKDAKPKVRHELLVGPSSASSKYIYNHQLKTNKVGTGIAWSPSKSLLASNLAGWLTAHRANQHGRQRGFLSRARTVESPAFSVDSGGRASASLGSSIAKILDVKQGHYADIYNQIDNPNASTRRPAEVIEDSVRNLVQNVFRRHGHDRQQSDSQHHHHHGYNRVE